MAEVIFNFEGMITIIKCNGNDKMKDIINKFLIKSGKQDDKSELYYLYNGTKIEYELSFDELANEFDKRRKKMNVIINKNDPHKIGSKEIISKDIICPECRENIFIDIKNFKVNLYGCKYNHFHNNILINLYEESQKIDLNTIICDICHQNNKNNTYNNEFHICNTCNLNISPYVNQFMIKIIL